MAGILDNRKTAELVIQKDANNYEKINPETLATIVEDVTNTEAEQVDVTVQQHIDNKEIHLTQDDVENLTADKLAVENVKAGSNITIKQEEGTNNITISAGDIPTESFLTGEDIIPEDKTITITPIEDTNKIHIRANIPDVSKMVEQENIKAGNEQIIVDYDPESNDVILYGVNNAYESGNGIKIVDNVISNTLPDVQVVLNEGSNITIEGEYPNFTISGTDKVKISNWESRVEYQIDDFVVYENSLFRCIEEHTSDMAFDAPKWQLIAGWSTQRQIFPILDGSSDYVILSEKVPNKDVLLINISGVWQQSQNYELEPDGMTIRFVNVLPQDSIVEVLVMSNVVLDTYDNKVNIQSWKAYTSYAVGNICIYDSSLYQCTVRHISTIDFQKENWELLSGFSKNSYFYVADEGMTSITLPKSAYKVTDILVNVGNTLLQSNNYSLDSTGKIVTFNEPIEEGAIIEVVAMGSAIIQHPEVPSPVNQPNQFVVSKGDSSGYTLADNLKARELLGFGSISTFENNANKVVGINANATDYELVSTAKLAANVRVRNTTEGYIASVIEGTKPADFPGMTKTKDDRIVFTEGSVMSKDKTLVLHLDNTVIKNPNKAFGRGDQSGSMVGLSYQTWTQPIMTSANTPFGLVETSEEQTDREGYRAMDGLQNQGNGWLANNTTATWSYTLPYDFIVREIDFYNQTSGVNNHSRDIDLWVDTPDNIVGTFTALDEDYGHSHVVIGNPQVGKTFGLTIKNSYGSAVGMNEIKMIAEYTDYLTENEFYYIYAIGNEEGTLNDVATSPYTEDDFAMFLPTNYDKYVLIGTFRTDNGCNIYNIYPNKDIKEAYVTGAVNGTLYLNHSEQYMFDITTNKPVKMIEQWGETIPTDGVVTFPIPFKKLLYVMANGEQIVAKTNETFTVASTVKHTLNWVAKGY